MSFVHFIELLLVVGILVLVGLPLFQKFQSKTIFSARNPAAEEYKHLLVRKEEILLAIKELEFDFRTEKVSEEDFERTKKDLEGEALAVLEKIDQLENMKKEYKIPNP
ncbi:MAG: hypothetical protein ACE5GQ_09515 [Nitrospinales bacterium]